jgi:hypothetical protein
MRASARSDAGFAKSKNSCFLLIELEATRLPTGCWLLVSWGCLTIANADYPGYETA